LEILFDTTLLCAPVLLNIACALLSAVVSDMTESIPYPF